MQTVDITRKIEFDSGHRIPEHGSKCRNLHGHRYVLECTVRGPVKPSGLGESDDGMVVDFGDLKRLMEMAVGEPWDHAFLAYAHDQDVKLAMQYFPSSHKTVWLPFVPTVENLATHAFYLLGNVINRGRYRVYHVRLWETPNCYADVWADTTEGGA